MKKDEIVRLHALLCQVRRAFEARTPQGEAFEAYDSFGVSPLDLHLDRRTHTRAIFLLGEALSGLCVREYGHEANLHNPLTFIRTPKAQQI